MSGFTHFDGEGRALMVDVTAKEVSDRSAVARASVLMAPSTLALIAAGRAAKGDVLAVARIAGIMAAKQTANLIPLCHPLALTAVTVDLAVNDGASSVDIVATCRVTAPTGVEMEALTACSVAALTVYDMVKAVDRGIRITDIRLVEKAGGASGTFRGE